MLRTLPLLTLDDTAARLARAGRDPEHIERLVAALRAGRTLRSVQALRDGDRVLVYDGAHRLEAHRRAYPLLIATLEISVEITGEGGPAEALALALGCNQDHGLPLSRADLRHRRDLVLTAEEAQVAAGAKRRSSRDLAEVIGCSHTYVSEWYAERGIDLRRRKPAPRPEPQPGQQIIGGGEVAAPSPARDPRRLPEAGDMLPLPEGDGTVRVVGVRRSARGWDVTVREHSPTGTPLGGTYGIPILEWWRLGGADQPGNVSLERDGYDRVLVWRQGVLPEYAGRPVETLEQALALLDERRTGPSLAVLRDRAEALLAALLRLDVETFELPGEPLQDVGLWLDALGESTLEELQRALPAIDAAVEAARNPKETPCPDPSPPAASPASPSVERAPEAPPATADDCADFATAGAGPTSNEPDPTSPPFASLVAFGDAVTACPTSAAAALSSSTTKSPGGTTSTTAETSATLGMTAPEPSTEPSPASTTPTPEAGPPSPAFPATTDNDCNEDVMLGEALDEARERIKALEAQVAALTLREGVQRDRADGWQRIAEQAKKQRDEALALLADLAELCDCAPTRAELAPRVADAMDAWKARQPVSPEEYAEIRERFLAGTTPAQESSDLDSLDDEALAARYHQATGLRFFAGWGRAKRIEVLRSALEGC